MELRTDIIPINQTIVGTKQTLDKAAICVFAATGFFLDQDSYYQELKVLKPACHYKIDPATQNIFSETPYFKWHHTPLERSFDSIVDDFASLFETIVQEQTLGQQIILPLSGGLDSRTQAVALHHLKLPVHSYSYAFENGHNETYYGRQIAKICGFPFEALTVSKGYLWNSIDALAELTQCYSEFTHSRQMAFKNAYASMGSLFSLGHWGDVLFDDLQVPDTMPFEAQVDVLMKKIIKKGGLSLADRLWTAWKLEGDFKPYLRARVSELLHRIDIPESANAQIRAFKSLYWAPRWTSINLSVFEAARPVSLPYYDARMCEFICGVPERYLAGRQIQIAYIKKRMPALAKVRWQDHRPFNIDTYRYNHLPWNLPYRVLQKLKSYVSTQPLIQRNWELQFLGGDNASHLEARLFNNPDFDELVATDIVTQFYDLFKNKDQVFYSHSVSILLTLSVFSSQQKAAIHP